MVRREKANAEKEAALALKAEIKSSVEGFNQRLKEAQENKKEALAALRSIPTTYPDLFVEIMFGDGAEHLNVRMAMR